MTLFEGLLLAMTLGSLWISKEVVVTRRKELLFKSKSKNSLLVAIALMGIPLLQIVFPDPENPFNTLTVVCDIIIFLAGLVMLLAKTGIAEDVILVNGLPYRYGSITEYQVYRNPAKGRTELAFRTKRNQRRLHFELTEYNQILKLMKSKKNTQKKKAHQEVIETTAIEKE